MQITRLKDILLFFRRTIEENQEKFIADMFVCDYSMHHVMCINKVFFTDETILINFRTIDVESELWLNFEYEYVFDWIQHEVYTNSSYEDDYNTMKESFNLGGRNE